MAKSWSTQETGYLKRYAATKTLEELVQRFEAEPDEVRAKLAELELTTRDGEPGGGAQAGPDPMIGPYEEGLEALYAGKWKKAAELFERVAADSDQPDLAARARQHLAAARRRAAAGEEKDEPYLQAVYAKNRGDLDEAHKIVDGQQKDDGGRFAYLAASLHALGGRPSQAAEALGRAIEADPRHKVNAYHDPDFADLRKDKDHAHLFGLES
jgi:tetratricopeptide (TPR) repeat protein